MTVEAYPDVTAIPINGVGPYDFNLPVLAASDVRVRVALVDGRVITLDPALYSVALNPLTPGGEVTLTAPTAATYDGRPLTIGRETVLEQGWEGVQGAREKSLEKQLDRAMLALQELRLRISASLQLSGAPTPMIPVAGRAIIFDDDLNPVPGPSATEISAAQAAALAAIEAMEIAIAKENSMLRARGAWLTATLYKPSDIVRVAGFGSYICEVEHTSDVFATDLAASRWSLFAADGVDGENPVGALLAGNNLSDLDDVAAARAALQLGSAAVLTAGTAANNAVQLDGDAKLPAVDGSQLTNLPGGGAGEIIAWGVFDGTITIPTLLAGSNVLSISRVSSTARFEVLFDDQPPDANYAVFTNIAFHAGSSGSNASAVVGDPTFPGGVIPTVDGFKITTGIPSVGGFGNFQRVFFMVVK